MCDVALQARVPVLRQTGGFLVDIILASTSEARRSLMDSLGVRYRAIAPGVSEAVGDGMPVREAVAMLARKKAEAVRARFPDALVIGADQLVDVDGLRLEKPSDRDEARRQLERLVGRTHEISTGLCVLAPGFDAAEVDTARPTFRGIDSAELERYLDLEEWRGCAGGYRIEAAGQALIEWLEGDRTSVQGLPMIPLVRMLRDAGVVFFQRRVA
jgi:septum formation protein